MSIFRNFLPPTPSIDEDSPITSEEDKFNEHAHLYSHETNEWLKLGEGKLTLVYNPSKPMFLLLRFQFMNTENETTNNNDSQPDFNLTFRPKLNVKNETTYILKGKNTETEAKAIIAVRFTTIDISKQFAKVIDWANTQNSDPLQRILSPTHTYKYMQNKYFVVKCFFSTNVSYKQL